MDLEPSLRVWAKLNYQNNSSASIAWPGLWEAIVLVIHRDFWDENSMIYKWKFPHFEKLNLSFWEYS